jgi:hypothetical protein
MADAAANHASSRPLPAEPPADSLLGQLAVRQARYPDVGTADTSRDAWIAAGKRDAAALMSSTAHARLLLAASLGLPLPAVRLCLLDSLVDPLSAEAPPDAGR